MYAPIMFAPFTIETGSHWLTRATVVYLGASLLTLVTALFALMARRASKIAGKADSSRSLERSSARWELLTVVLSFVALAGNFGAIFFSSSVRKLETAQFQSQIGTLTAAAGVANKAALLANSTAQSALLQGQQALATAKQDAVQGQQLVTDKQHLQATVETQQHQLDNLTESMRPRHLTPVQSFAISGLTRFHGLKIVVGFPLLEEPRTYASEFIAAFSKAGLDVQGVQMVGSQGKGVVVTCNVAGARRFCDALFKAFDLANIQIEAQRISESPDLGAVAQVYVGEK